MKIEPLPFKQIDFYTTVWLDELKWSQSKNMYKPERTFNLILLILSSYLLDFDGLNLFSCDLETIWLTKKK